MFDINYNQFYHFNIDLMSTKELESNLKSLQKKLINILQEKEKFGINFQIERIKAQLSLKSKHMDLEFQLPETENGLVLSKEKLIIKHSELQKNKEKAQLNFEEADKNLQEYNLKLAEENFKKSPNNQTDQDKKKYTDEFIEKKYILAKIIEEQKKVELLLYPILIKEIKESNFLTERESNFTILEMKEAFEAKKENWWQMYDKNGDNLAHHAVKNSDGQLYQSLVIHFKDNPKENDNYFNTKNFEGNTAIDLKPMTPLLSNTFIASGIFITAAIATIGFFIASAASAATLNPLPLIIWGAALCATLLIGAKLIHHHRKPITTFYNHTSQKSENAAVSNDETKKSQLEPKWFSNMPENQI